MTQLSLSHDALEAVMEDEAERNRLYEEFEVVSHENNEAFRMVSERINFFATRTWLYKELNDFTIDQDKQNVWQVKP